MKIVKVTAGFVSQEFERQSDGTFKCVDQSFFAGDDVVTEDMNGNPVHLTSEEDAKLYHPFNMENPTE